MNTLNRSEKRRLPGGPVLIPGLAAFVVVWAGQSATKNSEFVRLEKGRAWIRQTGLPKQTLVIGKTVAIKPDQILHCETNTVVAVNLGNGTFRIVRPCEFRVPNVVSKTTPTQAEITRALTVASRDKGASAVAWVSPSLGAVLPPENVALSWTPIDVKVSASITLSSLQSGRLYEEDQVDINAGKFDSVLLHQILKYQKSRGDLGPYTLKMDCGYIGSIETVFMLK